MTSTVNKSQQFVPAAPDTHFVRAAVLGRYISIQGNE